MDFEDHRGNVQHFIGELEELLLPLAQASLRLTFWRVHVEPFLRQEFGDVSVQELEGSSDKLVALLRLEDIREALERRLRVLDQLLGSVLVRVLRPAMKVLRTAALRSPLLLRLIVVVISAERAPLVCLALNVSQSRT